MNEKKCQIFFFQNVFSSLGAQTRMMILVHWELKQEYFAGKQFSFLVPDGSVQSFQSHFRVI